MAFQQWFALAVLFIINTINFLDRLSIAAVLSDIKAYFGLSSPEGGLLSTCFLGGYMLTAPIFGHLGDKYSRKYILIGGILFWCFATFSGSLLGKDHKYLFFIGRTLVGIGEASYSTIAPTIIADFFEPARRKLALSIFYFAIPIGSGLGFLIGTLAIELGEWQWAVRITPAIGLAATVLLFFLQEPKRGQADGAAVEQKDDSTVMDNVRYLWRIKSYVWSTTGFTGCLFTMGALSWWAIEFMVSARGKEYQQTAQSVFGGIVCAAGFLGVSIGSAIAQKYREFDGRADPLVCAIGVFIAVPLTFFGLLFAKSITAMSWVLLFLSVTALSTNWAVVSDITLSVTLPSKRAFATAIQILTTHLFGDAASPFIVGLIRDTISGGNEGDHDAFLYALVSTLPVLTLGAVAFLYSARFYVQDVETCQRSINKVDADDDPPRNESSNLADFARLP